MAAVNSHPPAKQVEGLAGTTEPPVSLQKMFDAAIRFHCSSLIPEEAAQTLVNRVSLFEQKTFQGAEPPPHSLKLFKISPSREAVYYFENGKRLYSKAQYEPAGAAFLEALKASPSFDEARVYSNFVRAQQEHVADLKKRKLDISFSYIPSLVPPKRFSLTPPEVGALAQMLKITVPTLCHALKLSVDFEVQAPEGLKGFHLDSKDKNDCTFLHYAACFGYQNIVALLLANKANMEAKDKIGRTPLIMAAFKGDKNIVSLLLKHRSNPEAKEPMNEVITAVYHLIMHMQKNNENVALLFHWALNNGHEDVLEILFTTPVNVHAIGSAKLTPLHYAAVKGNESAMQKLLERGARIEAKADFGLTSLHLAALAGHESVVQLLLDKEAYIEAKDEDGNTALHKAALAGHENAVQLLLDKDADMESKDRDDNTPLHKAALLGHETVINLLLDRGANKEAKDKNGNTPLHKAASLGQQNVVICLLENGVSMEEMNNDGKTPRDIAAEQGHETIVSLLQGHPLQKKRKLSALEEPF